MARAGLRQPHHEAPTSGRRCDSSRPDDLATELNPHKIELNPHQAVADGQPHKGQIKTVPSVPGGPPGGRPWLPQGFRRLAGPPPAVPGTGTRTSRLWAPEGWSSRYRVDGRGLARYRPGSVTPSDRRGRRERARSRRYGWQPGRLGGHPVSCRTGRSVSATLMAGPAAGVHNDRYRRDCRGLRWAMSAGLCT